MSVFISSMLSSPLRALLGEHRTSPPNGAVAIENHSNLSLFNEAGPALSGVQLQTEGTNVLGSTVDKQRRMHPDDATKQRIIFLHKQGLSYRQIGRDIGKGHKLVSGVVRKWTQTGHLNWKKNGGRPRKTSAQTDSLIARSVAADQNVTANDLKERLLLTNISEKTIARRIKELGQSGRRVRRHKRSEPLSS